MLSGKSVNYRMKQIPKQINTLYETHLSNKAIPKKDYSYYKKWLRYYLDFCFKYNHNKKNKQTLDLFIGKLKEKKHNDQQLKQAFHAISLYYELDLLHYGKDDLFKHKNQNLSIKKEAVGREPYCLFTVDNSGGKIDLRTNLE